MSHMPEILAVTTLNEYLYVVTRAGHLLPVYRYGPLTPSTTGNVPWAESWPEYNRSAVDTYQPVPQLDPAYTPDHLETYFGVQPRPGSHRCPWPQAVYRGWPLYLLGDGTRPSPDPTAVHDAEGALFRMVRVDIEQGPVTGETAGTVARIRPVNAPATADGDAAPTLSVQAISDPGLGGPGLDDGGLHVEGVPGFCGP